jgi:hypothetical protein
MSMILNLPDVTMRMMYICLASGFYRLQLLKFKLIDQSNDQLLQD